MRKLFVMIGLIVMLLFPVFRPQNIVLNASELTTTITTQDELETTTEAVVSDEVMTELEVQIERVKTFIIAFVVSVLGTGAVGLLAKFALNSLIKNLKDKIKVAEDKNEISSASATKIYAKLDEFNNKAIIKIDDLTASNRALVEQNNELSEEVKTLIQDIYARDEVLTELLEDTFLTEVDDGGVTDGAE